MVATETLGQTGGGDRRERLDVRGSPQAPPKGSWESLALEVQPRGQDRGEWWGLWWVG